MNQLGLVPKPEIITDEQFVKAHHPGAEMWGHRHGWVRIQDGSKILSDYIRSGTREFRRDKAWELAAAHVTELKHIIEELCFLDAAIKSADPLSPSMAVCKRIYDRLVLEFKKTNG